MRMLQARRGVMLGLAGAGILTAAACTTPASQKARLAQAKDEGALGVLVMAHGGGPKWNAQVEAMLAPLGQDYTVELAFGMADPERMQDAVRKLEARGASRIGVVRLFISGESFYERTEQILGLIPGAEPMNMDHAADGDAGHGGHNMDLWRIATNATFAMSKEGLADAPEMGEVLVERVRGLRKAPSAESVLIIAHGPEDDAENQRWLTLIGHRAEAVRAASPFRRVQVETLREDWPEKRVQSVERIRAFVEQAATNNGRALAIPYRVAGFGPYADVLRGLTYEADQAGLLPIDEVEHWVRRQVKELSAGPFRKPVQTAHGA